MRRVLLAIIVVAAVIVAWTSLRPAAPAAPTTAASLRIVSLSPAMTELLYELGLGESLVGVSESCNYPEAAKTLPRVGGLGTTNMEALLSLHPTLVATTDFETDDTMRALQSSGVQVIEGHIATVPQMFDAFARVGQATGRSHQAQALIDKMRTQLQSTARRFEQLPPERRPRVYLEIWHDPVTTAGRSSFLDDVVQHAGGVNVANGIAQAYPTISPEQVVAWNPQVIILCAGSTRGQGQQLMESRLGWEKVEAVQRHRVVDDLDLDTLIRPGPRLADGIAQLTQQLYPQDGAP